MEPRAQPNLSKRHQTQGVKRLLARQFARDDWSTPAPGDQDWSAVEGMLKLAGWEKARRVVVFRRTIKADLALSRKTTNEPGEQIEPLMPDKDVQAWECAVLVTNSASARDEMSGVQGLTFRNVGSHGKEATRQGRHDGLKDLHR